LIFLEHNRNRRIQLPVLLSWTAVVAWMSLIFYLSQQSGEQSGGLSNQIADAILRLFGQKGNLEQLESFESLLRILAHGGAFFVLALLLGIAFRQIHLSDRANGIASLISGLLYAASDEWHQSFIPGRSCEWSDFLTDATGIILAIIILQIYWKIRRVNVVLRVER
jgi:VanZ family protein